MEIYIINNIARVYFNSPLQETNKIIKNHLLNFGLSNEQFDLKYLSLTYFGFMRKFKSCLTITFNMDQKSLNEFILPHLKFCLWK